MVSLLQLWGVTTASTATQTDETPAPAPRPSVDQVLRVRPEPVQPHPTLRQGEFGAAVETAQRLLNTRGFSLKVDGTFGVNTRKAVVQFQRSLGLDADGVIGTRTWRALTQGTSVPSTLPTGTERVNALTSTVAGLGARMVDIARGELGTLETGKNRGDILKYPHAFGRGAEAWCADFVSWVSRAAGGTMNECYCPSVVNELKSRGLWKGRSNPQTGDIALFDWNNDRVADHIGIVERVNSNGTITTLEGNSTNVSNGRDGVWRQERSVTDVLGFGRPY